MKMDLADEVLKDLKAKKSRPTPSVVVAVKTGGDSRGARLLKAIKAEDADAIDEILCESDKVEPEED